MTPQEELTLGELRRALARGSNDQTIREALEARDRFELDEPPLEFAEWVEAGSPERYQAKTPAARRQARIDQLARQGG